MKIQNGFTLLETEKEFKEWLDKQKPTRKINKLQVHHMALPDYETWNGTDKRVYGDNRELGRTMALDSYGKTTWGSSDGYGHYIAQHFNIFPNGKITTGRNLNSTPIGIKGWNANAICIEIYGNFDKGQDAMTEEQKQAVIFVFALLAEKFNLPINSTYIRPHAWFTSGGTYLGDYNKYKSRKTCPGTNFMGFGNTRKAFENNFYPLLKAYKYGSNNTTTTDKTLYVKIKEDINMHSKPDFTSASVIGVIKKGGVYTVVERIERTGTDMYKLKSGVYITASPKYVETFEK
ncbi:N-acetylmuramoyl-L-alanine amidase [Clostridium sp. 1001270J_160509_D11]|uniref:N-acetylmuramoyl-L-alanine amidase n=1 Tax=Clostridium sp. 1001270J_160509_D11 TaxID=2787103 RepID=UPI0018AA2066|nr:N-acetylmuramoyl-L-alanine amidase [Clostridium sp. 1001270J_160509_D11]